MTRAADMTLYLSFYHPRRRAAEITAALRMDPERCWDRGAARNIHYGRALAGRESETYWSTTLPDLDDFIGLAKAIAAQLDRLDSQKDFIRSFADTGGRVELEIFWRLNSAVHTDLPFNLINRLVEFGMGISLHPMTTP